MLPDTNPVLLLIQSRRTRKESASGMTGSHMIAHLFACSVVRMYRVLSLFCWLKAVGQSGTFIIGCCCWSQISIITCSVMETVESIWVSQSVSNKITYIVLCIHAIFLIYDTWINYCLLILLICPTKPVKAWQSFVSRIYPSYSFTSFVSRFYSSHCTFLTVS